jgi:hypothetical protein
MTNIKRLCSYSGPSIQRGTILRCPGSYPYEEVVDFLVCEPIPVYDTDRGKGARLMVASGYKAGLTLVVLPGESKPDEFHGLKTEWLKANWNKWVYECPMEDVWVVENFVPEMPQIP